MLQGGVLDELSLTAALLPSRTHIRHLPAEMRFRSLLIDEFQDFSTLDLALLRLLPLSPENGLFVTGDPVQRVLVKSLRLSAVGLDIISAQRERITKNYRNSKQILEAASSLANSYAGRAKVLGEDVEWLDPGLAERETARPVALKVPMGEEIESAWRIVSECCQSRSAAPWSICIATGSPAMLPVAKILAQRPTDLPVNAAPLRGDFARVRDTLNVGAIGDLKGFEFSMVIVVGCGKGCLPAHGCCQDESWREAFRLYVAMTRARDHLTLIYSGQPSEFLITMEDQIQWDVL
jgi:superfamily I DNA/RNA helicase